jgi:hypothetical protein
MTLRRLALVALVAVAVAVAVSPIVGATEAKGFTVTDTALHHKKDFGPIIGNNPAYDNPALVVSLSDCQTLPTSTAVEIGWKISSTRPTKSAFTLTWPAADANDLDMYFFNEEGDLIAQSASGDPKESFNIGGLENGTYWLCVNNFSGANAGFTVEVDVDFLSLYERPPPPPTPIVKRSPKPTPAPTATPEPTVPPAPTPSPETVTTPGPDGPTKARDLVAVADRSQATPTKDSRSGLAIGLLALTGLIAVSGASLVVLRIRRDTTG